MEISASRQLYQLQEIDLELDANEQALRQIQSQLGESEVVVNSRHKLTSEQQRQEQLLKEQHSLEWDITDLNNKLNTIREKLYSGRIHNPKELTDLQHESNALQAKRAQFEDRALAIMEQVELTTQTIAALSSELKRLEAEWQSQQQKLSASLEQRQAVLSGLRQKRQAFTADISPAVIEVYQGIKGQKGTAVAKVEQGMCRGCRISLPLSELQRARGGELVRCGSCGRILFLA